MVPERAPGRKPSLVPLEADGRWTPATRSGVQTSTRESLRKHAALVPLEGKANSEKSSPLQSPAVPVCVCVYFHLSQFYTEISVLEGLHGTAGCCAPVHRASGVKWKHQQIKTLTQQCGSQVLRETMLPSSGQCQGLQVLAFKSNFHTLCAEGCEIPGI